MTGGDNRRMVFIIKCRRSKVNEANLAVKQDTSLTRISRNDSR
jgi:hypothetical protein